MATLTLKSDQRIFLCGRTESGKTYLARYLVRSLDRLLVLDAKSSPSISQWGLEEPSRTNVAAFRNGKKARIRVREYEREAWDKWFDLAWQAGNCVIYIDEINGIIPPGSKPDFRINRLWTQGRERGIGGWAATQRPAWIPLFFISEADWLFMFKLRNEDDRKRMAGYMGDQVKGPIRNPHGFYFSYVGWDNPAYCPQFKA